MGRLNTNLIILIIIIIIFGFIFPFLSWIEERKISTILQSLSILTVYFILFFQTFKEKLKNKKSYAMIIHYLENLVGLIYEYHINLAKMGKSKEADEFIKNEESILISEIQILKEWYKDDLRKLHCQIRELKNILSILIQFQDSRYVVNYMGINKFGKGRLDEDITSNLKEHKKLIQKLYQWI